MANEVGPLGVEVEIRPLSSKVLAAESDEHNAVSSNAYIFKKGSEEC